MNRTCSLGHRHAIQWLGLLTAMLFLLTPTLAWAKYRPQKPSAPKGNTTLTGTRGGCDDKTPGRLTALAPISHLGQTISTHPTFAWFVPDSKPVPLKFQLYRASENQWESLYTTTMQTQPGLMRLTLPADRPGLAPEQTYLWQVVMQCQLGSPSADAVIEAQIQIIPPQDLKTGITDNLAKEQQANLYAEAGLWYDALAAAWPHEKPSPDRISSESLRSLMADLVELEANSATPVGQAQSDRLKQVLALPGN